MCAASTIGPKGTWCQHLLHLEEQIWWYRVPSGRISEAQWLRQLEAENAKLKRIVAEQALDNIALKDLLSKTGKARCQKGSRCSFAKAAWLLAAAGLSVSQLQSQERALRLETPG